MGGNQVTYNKTRYPLYPQTLDGQPDVPSPFVAEDGTEILTCLMKRGEYTLVPVTVENGEPLHYSRRVGSQYGKDQQLEVDGRDFPPLAQTGLHVEAELDHKDTITGMPVSVITYIARPRRFSRMGFIADDEDILSVLKGDNDLVRRMGLTHPQMARPLFHVWNIVLVEIALGEFGRFSGMQSFLYNGKQVMLRAENTKGWQRSIFQDEIQGRFDLCIRREMSSAERSFLHQRYSHLVADQLAHMEEKLTSIRFSEMAPYYIMRYGFYEGHTAYRSDPIAIAYLSGLRELEEIETAFQGCLYRALTDHYVSGGSAG